jgi:hypothetical protein
VSSILELINDITKDKTFTAQTNVFRIRRIAKGCAPIADGNSQGIHPTERNKSQVPQSEAEGYESRGGDVCGTQELGVSRELES